jgi:transcriptional regulator with XRE-family HTH domain
MINYSSDAAVLRASYAAVADEIRRGVLSRLEAVPPSLSNDRNPVDHVECGRLRVPVAIALSSGLAGGIVPGNVCLSRDYVMSRSHNEKHGDLSITRQEKAEIGARIRAVRGAANQTKFAERLGISRAHLSRIESGAKVPGTATLRSLARVAPVSLDFIVLGADFAALRAAAEGAGSWEAALQPLLAGTPLRLPQSSTASGRKADQAWHKLPEERREEIRDFVRRIALVAVATEALLPPKTARAATDQLSMDLKTILIDRILAVS